MPSQRDCFYIGALGSRKTHAKRAERLKAQGASDADIARIHAPIGLDIGAVSPSEIAVSIMAEITAELRLPQRSERAGGMKFGPASPADAIGGVTVHTLRQGSLVLKKGTTIGPAEVEALDKAGVKEVVVVRLEEGDVSEDVAAASIAQAVAGDGVNVERAFTGRANLFAAQAGVLVVDRAAVDRINGVDEAITFATLAAFKPVVEGEMIATVKLIPFGVEAKLRDAAVAVAGKRRAADRALRHQARRRRLDLAAGAGAEGDRQDLARHRGAAGAGRRHHHRRAARAA